ncbi:hypothetical protein BASA60_005235 [Batrachochytrium salamandrivorans]|nr:hypothetical protein BASA62_005040 [Batrachochytrium salamandrivorans]KAH6574976.1 hypothetical protein BASA60_005235 [Batrachochytrium salamandrivorans]KAH9248178.1 hypothetical protein BASA81_014171 [Batrachochytrium salamandrivorans]
MKLAAATLLSLTASVTYALPPAYPENQMDMHYSAFNELISAHMKKRAENRQKFIDIVNPPKPLVDSSHYQQGLQGPHGSKEDKKYQKQQKRKVEHQKRRLRKEALWDWEARQLFDPNLYGYRHGKLTYPEYLFNKKRPDLVEPSDEALVQLGTTNKNKDDRIKSWEKTEDDKAPHKRPEHESNFYQNRQTEYQKFMQLDNGKRRHSEHIRRLEGKRRHSRFKQQLEYRIYTARHMHGPPKPVPKVIETEPPKPLKSILKKKYVDPENERKVDFNRVAQKAQYAPFEDEDPFQNQDSTKSSHFSLKWFGDKPKDKGNTDTTDDNHPDNHPDSHPDNQPTFDIQEVPINDSGDTTSKQPDDEVPSQNKISTESSDLGVRE